jgi:hypothetical protein
MAKTIAQAVSSAPKKPDSRTAWHAPYIGSLKAELMPYLDRLTFESEVQLTSEPLIIDGVIIKKEPGLVIEKNFARFFRSRNIVEIKSRTDYLSAGAFHKCLAYVHLYSSLKVGNREQGVGFLFASLTRCRYALSYNERLSNNAPTPH